MKTEERSDTAWAAHSQKHRCTCTSSAHSCTLATAWFTAYFCASGTKTKTSYITYKRLRLNTRHCINRFFPAVGSARLSLQRARSGRVGWALRARKETHMVIGAKNPKRVMAFTSLSWICSHPLQQSTFTVKETAQIITLPLPELYPNVVRGAKLLRPSVAVVERMTSQSFS